jgi:CysZ protein
LRNAGANETVVRRSDRIATRPEVSAVACRDTAVQRGAGEATHPVSQIKRLIRPGTATMVIALTRAVAALAAPPLQRVVALSLGLSIITLAALWLAIASLLFNTSLFAWSPFNWLVQLLGSLAVLALSWLLFPAVVTLVMGTFLNRVAAAVEASHYPGLSPPRVQPWNEIVVITLRLTGAAIVLNLMALPLYLLVPGINLILFLALNGYLNGRGYFELVALRRFDATAVKALRHRFAGRVLAGGIVIAGMFALPLVNLVAPVIATAFMVHLFEALPRIAPQSAAGSVV